MYVIPVKYYKFITALLISTAAFMLSAQPAYALTIGETYTISIEKINSNGTVTTGTTSLGLSTTATADSNGKLGFSFTGTTPDKTSCNFMVITLKNSSSAIIRQTIVPCPNAGATLPLGISGVTNKQATALLAAFSAAGSDDPILAVFAFTIVRSTGISASQLTFMANLIRQGISGTNGFVADMTGKGVTTTQLATYRSAIVSKLADPTTGYSKLLKDSVDVSSLGDATLEAAKRGEAAARLLGFLVSAATDAGFSQDRVLEAFNAMGAVVVPLMSTAVANGDLTAATLQSINSSVGGGIQKLKADRSVAIYTQALSTLNASGADLTKFTTAATTLSTTMSAAFKQFDKVFTGSETQTDVNTANTAFNTAMTTAFTTFTNSTSATNARITTMIAKINTAVGVSPPTSSFKYSKSNGTQTNWPIMMVIPTDYLSDIKTAGGNITYARDTIAIPTTLTRLGTCSVSSYTDKTACEAASKTWTSARTDYGAAGIPLPYAAMFGIQEDVMIREFVRFAAQNSAGQNMSAQNTLEKAFSDSLVTMAGKITGTTNGTTAISAAVKKALVELMKSPQF